MIINIYLDRALKVISIKGDLWGEFNPTLVSVGSILDYVVPDIAVEVKKLIHSDNESYPFLPETNQSVRNIGCFRHSLEEAEMEFELWQLCKVQDQGIVYLLECNVLHTDIKMDITALHLLEQADIPSFGILQLDENWNTTYVSKTFTEMVGYTQKDISNRNWVSIIDPVYYESFTNNLYKNTQSDRSFDQDLKIRKGNGCIEWVSVHYKKVYDPNRACANYILIFLDIDHRRRDQDQLREMAERDQLTGLGNRYALQQRLENDVRQLHPDGEFSLLYLDLDGFKAVNDGYGHAIGDKLLKVVAARLVDLCSEYDFIARLGGDEFAIVRHQLSFPGVDQFAQNLLSRLSEPYKLVKFAEESYVSCSVGIVPVDAQGINYANTLRVQQTELIVGRLLSQADAAMYDAKSAGRNTYRFYAAHLDEKAQRNLKINNALYRALDREEFQIHYQPQWCLKSDSLYGYEALIRWPSFSSTPEQFIPIAENNGLMGHLGRWVIEKAFSDHAKLLKAYQQHHWYEKIKTVNTPLPQLSVNISPIQFRDHKLLGFIEKILMKYDVPASNVTLEITESLLISNNIEIDSRLKDLKEMGLKIALDDFGTGYSSLSNLHEFPIDIIKIDKSFLKNVNQFETSQVIKAILQLGSALNKKVVIEGVETNQQYDFCKLESEAVIQGWLVAKALPFEHIKQFIVNKEPLWQTQYETKQVVPLLLKNHN